MNAIDSRTLRDRIEDAHELAILDAREEAEFGTGHLFWAVPCPLSRRESRARSLLPRLGTRIVCVDDGGGSAESLAGYLQGLGCADISVLEGGVKAWADSGLSLFPGTDVLGRAFAAWIAGQAGTPVIDAAGLKSRLADNPAPIVLDCRPHDVFLRGSVPTAFNLPFGCLAYGLDGIAPGPAPVVVVGRDHAASVLGAETLRRTDPSRQVMALRDGMLGWDLARLRTERGRSDHLPADPPASDLRPALDRARGIAESAGVSAIGAIDLARFEEDSERTCYVLDVREPGEFRARHRPGSCDSPAGQLLLMPEQWLGVRGARIVLIDDDGVRARLAGFWLRQMGWRDVFVADGALADLTEGDRAGIRMPEPAVKGPSIDVQQLTALLDTGDRTVIVDVGRSLDYRNGHIPGAIWGVRSRLDGLRDTLATARHVVVSSPGGSQARLAVPELQGLTQGEVRALDGGTDAWHAFGRPLVRDRMHPSDAACVDVWLRPENRNAGVDAAIRTALDWDAALPDAIAAEGTVRFGVEAGGR